MEWKLELVPIPVSDVDRAKAFYTEKAGFNEDLDHRGSDEFRIVQLTPPWVGLLDRARDRNRRHAAGLGPGSAAGGLGHRGCACGARRAGARGQRRPAFRRP
jgi:catechol 2,3-dioxygenase-like lactoylglutathione lyase family enzyme